MTITLVRTERSMRSDGGPCQWDAWDAAGQYYYLRFRHRHGTVHALPGPDTSTWKTYPRGALADFRHGDLLDGVVGLEEFCRLAGLQLARGASAE